MKKGGGHEKGAEFERKVCKMLSLWWSDDFEQQRDDLFWRTAGSGSRATTRDKEGKETVNSYGDIAATNEVGLPLLRVCCFELKRGYNPDLWSWFSKSNKDDLSKAWKQCRQSSEQANVRFPVLIFQADRRPIFIMSVRVFFYNFGRLLGDAKAVLLSNGCAIHRLDDFLDRVPAREFRSVFIRDDKDALFGI